MNTFGTIRVWLAVSALAGALLVTLATAEVIVLGAAVIRWTVPGALAWFRGA